MPALVNSYVIDFFEYFSIYAQSNEQKNDAGFHIKKRFIIMRFINLETETGLSHCSNVTSGLTEPSILIGL
jgi:hypothetical protein